jgi:hypothetical protein
LKIVRTRETVLAFHSPLLGILDQQLILAG